MIVHYDSRGQSADCMIVHYDSRGQSADCMIVHYDSTYSKICSTWHQKNATVDTVST